MAIPCVIVAAACSEERNKKKVDGKISGWQVNDDDSHNDRLCDENTRQVWVNWVVGGDGTLRMK